MAKAEYEKFKKAYDAGARRPISEGSVSEGQGMGQRSRIASGSALGGRVQVGADKVIPVPSTTVGASPISTEHLSDAELEGMENLMDAADKAASPEEAQQLEQMFKEQMRMPPGASKSPAEAEMGRMIASNNSIESENLSMMKELGMVDGNGQDITEGAVQAQKLRRDAKASQLQGFMERQAPVEPKVEEGKVIPLNEKLRISKENTLFQMAGGIADLSQSVVNLGIEVANMASTLPEIPPVTFADDMFPNSDYAGQRMLRAATQFLVPYAGLSKIAQTAGVVSTVGRAAIAGTATDFLAFEGNEERLSNLIEETGLGNPITEYLAADPSDTAIEGRFKNVLEGSALGGLAEGLFKGIKFIKQSRQAKGMIDNIAKVEAGELKGSLPASVVEAEPISVGEMVSAKAPEISPEQVLKPRADITGSEEFLSNLERIDARPEIKDVIKNISEADTADISGIVGAPHRLKELDAEAAKAGITVDMVLQKPAAQPLTEIESHVLRTAVVTKTEEVHTLAKTAVASGDPDDMAKFMLAKNDFVNLFRADKYSAATASRILGSRRAVVSAADPGQLNAMVELSGAKGWKMAEMVSQMKPQDLASIASKTPYRKAFDAVFEVYISNILGGVGTHITNFVSSPATLGVNIARRAVAPIFGSGKTFDGKVITELLGKRQVLLAKRNVVSFDEMMKIDSDLRDINTSLAGAVNDAGVQVGEAGKLILGVTSGLKDAVKALTKEGGLQELAEKAKIRNTSPAEADRFKPALTSSNIGGGRFIDMFGTIQRKSLSALQYADDFWKVVFSRGELHATVHRLGVAQGLEGQALKDFSENMIAKPPDYILAEGNKFAELNTFTTPLEGMAKKFDELRNEDILGAPHLKMLLPFFKTPANIAAEAMSQTPASILGLTLANSPFVNGIVPRYTQILKNGGAEAQLLKSKIALGNAVFGVAAGMAAYGFITGSGPRDFRKQKILKETGWEPNSIKVGDAWFPLKNLGPLGTAIGIAADISDIARYAGDDNISAVDPENSTMAQAGQLASLLSFTVLERSAPEGFVRNMGMIFDAVERNDTSMLSRIASNLVPLSGYVKNFKGVYDPTIRNAQDESFFIETINRIKDSIPGLSSTLPAYRNIFGDEIHIPSPLGVDGVTAFFGSEPKGKNDTVLKEMVRLGYYGPLKSKEAPAGEGYLSINLPPKSITLGNGIADLDPKQYDRYVQLSAGIGLKDTDGSSVNTLREALSEAIANYGDFGATTDQQKRMVLKGTINLYRKMAAQQLVEEIPEINDKLEKSRSSFMRVRGEEIGQ